MKRFIFKTKKMYLSQINSKKIPVHYFVIGRLFLCLPDYKAKAALIGQLGSSSPDTACTLRSDWLVLVIFFNRRTVWSRGSIFCL